MTITRKLTTLAGVTAGCLTLGLAWLYAQEAEPTDAEPADKWIQIQKNNQEMNKSLEQVEQNLNFIKARSMSGGRSS